MLLQWLQSLRQHGSPFDRLRTLTMTSGDEAGCCRWEHVARRADCTVLIARHPELVEGCFSNGSPRPWLVKQHNATGFTRLACVEKD